MKNQRKENPTFELFFKSLIYNETIFNKELFFLEKVRHTIFTNGTDHPSIMVHSSGRKPQRAAQAEEAQRKEAKLVSGEFAKRESVSRDWYPALKSYLKQDWKIKMKITQREKLLIVMEFAAGNFTPIHSDANRSGFMGASEKAIMSEIFDPRSGDTVSFLTVIDWDDEGIMICSVFDESGDEESVDLTSLVDFLSESSENCE